MSARYQADKNPWDLSHIVDFVNTLSPNSAETVANRPLSPPPTNASIVAKASAANTASHQHNIDGVSSVDFVATDGGIALGNFAKVWQFLGTPAPSADTPRSGHQATSTSALNKDDYASDGAAYIAGKGKGTRRHLSMSDGTDGEASADLGSSTETQQLTKTQKKRMRRKERKEKEFAKSYPSRHLLGAVSESEVDSNFGRGSPARKASKHVMNHDPIAAWNLASTTISQQQKARLVAAGMKRNEAIPLRSSQAQPKVKETFKQTAPHPGQSGAQCKYSATTHTEHGRSSTRPLSRYDEEIPSGTPKRDLPLLGANTGLRESGRTISRWKDDQATTNQAVQAVAAAMALVGDDEPPATPSPNQSTLRTKAVHNPATTPNQQKNEKSAHAGSVLQTPNSIPRAARIEDFVPATVGTQPMLNGKLLPFDHQSQARVGVPTTPNSATSASKYMATKMVHDAKRGGAAPPSAIEPKIIRSGEDRHFALLMKIISTFGEDRKYLVSPMNMINNNNAEGLHVFVDASNIFIGFMDQLKMSRGIHPNLRMPDVDLSFDGLALLMERRRPVAKRVLVGSNPHIPAFDIAKAVGYETHILEKVYKSRELTERQIYFKQLDEQRFGKKAKAPHANNLLVRSEAFPPPSPFSTLGNSGSGGGISGTETSTPPQYAPAKMIEQGVDEILHLKMLESLVDCDTPSTIVLATGDAAKAEYSQGFMAMVERALKKGWSVELVSWSKNISQMYIRSRWTDAWGGRFKIIYLDDFAEELLHM